jgi:hypothetical protein
MEKKIGFAFLYILLFPTVLLLLSGDSTWPEGWIFSVWFILLCFSTILHLYRKDPALLAERYKQPGSGNREGGTGMLSTGSWSGSFSGSSSCRWMQNGLDGHRFFPSG